MSWLRIILSLGVALVVFGTIVGLEFAYRQKLFDQTFKFAHDWQSNESKGEMKAWMYFSETGIGTLPAVILVMTLDYRQRSRQVYYIMMFTFALIIMGITKMAYKQQRPFWVDPTLHHKGACDSEFGNPSGHSLIAAAMVVTIALDIAHHSVNHCKVLWNLLIWTLAAAYFLLMGFSRVVLGVHSLNQILYGWCLGIWVALFCFFILHDFLKKRVDSILSKKTFNVAIDFIVVVIVNSLLIAAQIITYAIVSKHDPIQPAWALVVATLCETPAKLAFQNESLKSVGITMMFLGAYVGVLFQYKLLNGQTNLSMPSRLSILKGFGRLCILIVIIVPWAALMTVPKIDNIWGNLVVKNALATFGLVSTLTAFFDWICLKLKLYDNSRVDLISEMTTIFPE